MKANAAPHSKSFKRTNTHIRATQLLVARNDANLAYLRGQEILEHGTSKTTGPTGDYECLVFKGFGDLHLFIISPLVGQNTESGNYCQLSFIKPSFLNALFTLLAQ